MAQYQVTIYVEVHDEDALYEAAVANYGATRAEADLHMKGPDGELNIAACLIQVFDPGAPPPGTAIIESTASADGL